MLIIYKYNLYIRILLEDIVTELWLLKQANSSQRAQESWKADLPVDLKEYLDNLTESQPIDPGRLVMLKDFLFVSLFDSVYRDKLSDLREKYYRMLVDLAIAKSLTRLSRREVAEPMLLKICRFGEKYGFPDLIAESAAQLASYYADFYKHYKKHLTYLEKSHDAMDLIKLDLKFSCAFYSLRELYFRMGHSTAKMSTLHQISERHWKEVQPYLWTAKSYKFHVNAVLLGYLYHELRDDLPAAISLAQRGIDHFQREGWNYPMVIYTFYINMIQAGMKLGHDDQVMQWIGYLKSVLMPNSNKWYSMIFSELLVLCKLRRYQEAFEIFLSNYQRTFYKRTSQLNQRRWSLMRLYLDYLIDVGVVQATSRMQRRNFKSDYVDIPNYSREKQGRNVAVIVIQLLHHIRRREYDMLAIRFTALKRYSTKYLRKDGNYRSGCFIKMLLEIPKRGFRQEAIRRHAAKYLKKMEDQPHSIGLSSQELEIIPYPDLWEIALSSIKSRPQRETKTLRELREI